PSLAAARANWLATQERVPQARSGLLPNVGISGTASATDGRSSLRRDQTSSTSNNLGAAGFTISASQPLYRQQDLVDYDQARRQVPQADYTLAAEQQDLIIRVAIAYFDVLLAEENVELSEAQKA